MTRRRKTILSLLLATAGLFAFTLSFNAQAALAVGGGIEPALAFMYPGIIDVAIVAGILVRIWAPDIADKLARYLWAAIAFWTATSIAGNAISILALPENRITIPVPLAIAVHAMPAVTLFLIMHITAAIAFRTPAAAAAPRPRRTASTSTSSEAPPPRGDIPPVTDSELLKHADAGMSMAEIARSVGRSKSYVGARVKAARDARQEGRLSA